MAKIGGKEAQRRALRERQAEQSAVCQKTLRVAKIDGEATWRAVGEQKTPRLSDTAPVPSIAPQPKRRAVSVRSKKRPSPKDAVKAVEEARKRAREGMRALRARRKAQAPDAAR